MQGIKAVLRHEADIGQNEATPGHTATAPDNQANIFRMGQHKVAKAEDDRNMEAELQGIQGSNTLPDCLILVKKVLSSVGCNHCGAVSCSLDKPCLLDQ